MSQFFHQLCRRLLQQMELLHANPSSLKLARPRVKDPLCGCSPVSYEGGAPHPTGGPLGYYTDPLAVVVAQRENRGAEPYLAPGLDVHRLRAHISTAVRVNAIRPVHWHAKLR